MYKLFTDKSELFECDIKLQGASLKKSKARLVVETSDYALMFNGSIYNSGKCEIPIKKLKGLIEEDTTGNIRLEVIAEDTFFTPWESDFEVETSKKVTVEVKSQHKKPRLSESTGPMVKVSGIRQKKISLSERQHVINILRILIRENINIKNLSIKRNKLNNIIAEYISKNPVKQKRKVINKVVKVLSKKK